MTIIKNVRKADWIKLFLSDARFCFLILSIKLSSSSSQNEVQKEDLIFLKIQISKLSIIKEKNESEISKLNDQVSNLQKENSMLNKQISELKLKYHEN